ncbi:hypothetical protein [Cerasicoccus arenae]|uniref:Transposase n=1 Tax=Cerasicoccus arenae TaxID=424488 RepID=A0A8J3DKC6_9BACT|nr:hypothetical protein [Cerasicoccus arenae]MBK1858354.1 hypothetical protein [Cerasicoccus arenae]GHC09764.1 hypothetical protein GCM10007047_28830 [Cerasicoccus arenae]
MGTRVRDDGAGSGKQLKGLQKENARLKRMLADEMLGKELLKEALEKSYEPGHKREVAEGLVEQGRCSARLLPLCAQALTSSTNLYQHINQPARLTNKVEQFA